MATILRSSRYIRGLSNLARRVRFTRNHADTVSTLMLDASVCSTSSSFVKSYTNKVAHKESESIIDQELKKLNESAQRYGRLRRLDVVNILKHAKKTKKLSSTQALMLLSCCGNLLVDETPQMRLDIVKELWNIIEYLDIPVDISHYNALLKVYLDNEYSFTPINFLVELEKKKIEPNRVTYQRFIARYCNIGDIAGATKILQFMNEKQLPINENVFNSLITGYARAGDMENALNVLNVMKQGGVNPSTTTYATLLCAYAEKGDIEAIRNVLATCQSQEIFLTDMDYMDVVYSLVLKGHKQYVEEIMSLMPKSAGYTFEATNLIHKLLNIGEVDLALQLLLSVPKKVRNDGKTAMVGSFVLRKFASIDVSTEKIIEICKHLESKEVNNQAFYMAINSSFKNGDPNKTMKLLQAWKETGATIKEHFFWPVLVAHGNQSNFEGIVETIDVMTELGLSPSIQTLKDYVLPYAVGKSREETINILMEHNIQSTIIINAFSVMLLENEKSMEAYEFMRNYSGQISVNLMIKPLIDAFLNNGDVKNFVNITRLLEESHGLKTQVNEDGIEETQQIRFSVCDTLLLKLLNIKSTSNIEVIEKILENFIQQGLTISIKVVREIENSFATKMTSQMSKFCNQLISGQWILHEIKDLERIKAKGDPWNDVSKILVTKYIAIKDEEKVTNLLTELRGKNVEFTSGFYAKLINFYSSQENLEEADKCFEELKNLGLSNELKNDTLLNYATLLLKNDRHNEALQLIQNVETNNDFKQEKDRTILRARILLDFIAEKGDPDQLNVFFEAITSKNMINILKPILYPLVKVHVVRNDLEAALATFEKCAQQHNCTPYKQELSKKFILAKDAASLQRLTDISTQVHGEINSLQDLATAFIECDRVRQAKKIFETPGLFTKDQRLLKVAQNYATNGDETFLKKLLEATKNTTFSNRSELYYFLLYMYSKDNNWTEGLATWMMMQEENVQPSEKFLRELATLLENNGKDVPFVYQCQPLNSDDPVKNSITDIEEHINRGQFDSIEKIFAGEKLKFVENNYTAVIMKLLDVMKLDEGIEFTKRVLVHHPNIVKLREFKEFIKKVSKAGKIREIEQLRQLAPSDHLTSLFFNQHVMKAYAAAGQIEKFLENLAKNVISNSEVNERHLFFPALMLQILESDPSIIEKYKPYAVKLADHGFTAPINILWCYYLKNRMPEAEEIWSKYLVNSNILFKVIWSFRDISDNKQLLNELTEKIHESKMPLEKKYAAYNNLIFLYNKTRLFQEGLELLNELVKTIPLERFNASILQYLKHGLEKSGHSFPYKIFEQRNSDAASA